jgi:endonuclease V-like protein UPF0215 family
MHFLVEAQNHQICASQRTAPDDRDVRQIGGFARAIPLERSRSVTCWRTATVAQAGGATREIAGLCTGPQPGGCAAFGRRLALPGHGKICGAPRLGMPGSMVTVTGQSPSPRAPQGQSVLEAVLERITYANDDTGYTVARVATERTGPDLRTVAGPLLGAQIGGSLRLTGRWSTHPRYGTQFEVHSYTTVLPATIQGIRRYLGSGMIKGIGPMMAERMVTHFGTAILTIIEEEPGRLIEVHGLGPKRTKKIAEAWEEQKAIKEKMVFLAGVGVSTSLAVRIYKKYAAASISVVRNEPYRLASEVWGIGFKTADTIARAVGIPHDSPEQIRAGLQYTLSQAADDGHCYLPEPNLIREATRILEVDRELIGPCLDELAAGEGVVREPVPAGDNATGGAVPAVYLVPFYRAECSLAGGLMDLLNCGQERLPAFARVDWHKALGWLRSQTGQELAPEQREAVKLALSSKAAVLTGGPGWQELHHPLRRRARHGQEGHRGAGRAHRPGRRAAGGADRPRGLHRAPAAGAAARRRPQVRPRPPAGRRSGRGG